MTCKQCKNFLKCMDEAFFLEQTFDPNYDGEHGCCDFSALTNADRIRAMSDEELAEFLILSPEMEFDVCRYCEYGNPTPMDDRGFCSCLANAKAEAFKKRLKQPVKDGDNDD